MAEEKYAVFFKRHQNKFLNSISERVIKKKKKTNLEILSQLLISLGNKTSGRIFQ